MDCKALTPRWSQGSFCKTEDVAVWVNGVPLLSYSTPKKPPIFRVNGEVNTPDCLLSDQFEYGKIKESYSILPAEITLPDPQHSTKSRRYWWMLLIAGVGLLIAIGLLVWIPYQRQIALLDRIVAAGGNYGTPPSSRPEWLDKFLGERWTQGFGDVYGVDINGSLVDDDLLKDISTLSNLRYLECEYTQITDAGLAPLNALKDLQWLNLRNTQTTDVGLAHLKGLTNLRRLYLNGTQITDAGIVNLRGFRNLVLLELEYTQTTDAGLAHLKTLTNLKKLDINDTNVTDAGLVHLSGLTKLEFLDLHNTNVSDAGLVHLKGLTELESLELWNNKQISDAGLVDITGLTNLKYLDLRNTQVSDTGIAHLKRLTNLETLHLSRTQVSLTGLKTLKAALPDCEIFPSIP